ncbi:MAG: teichoic acid synthase [Propionibacteriaceae bacterium]|jgi:CDP-glycerol glycerophosphotransferase|nr:teichoic acid synthase [Propionibacteriaceae bacterium]
MSLSRTLRRLAGSGSPDRGAPSGSPDPAVGEPPVPSPDPDPRARPAGATDSVFYESFFGAGMLCNPEAIFEALLDAPDQQHLTHVWALEDESQLGRARAEFAADPRVRFVRSGSPEYGQAMEQARYLVNNSPFPASVRKRPDQTYLNTWHGTPLKHMGFDEPNGRTSARNTLRNFLSADFLLSSSPYMTERMYLDGYRLRDLYSGTIIETGTPRIDRQFVSAAQVAAEREQLIEAGVRLDPDRKLVLYAPTWKGSSFRSPLNEATLLAQRVRALNDRLDSAGIQVLLKVHQSSYAAAQREKALQGVLVPNDRPTNRLLGLVEGLVTDYSSILFDFLATGRPLFFLTPDFDHYVATRGVYLNPAEWPGPRFDRTDDLASSVIDALGGEGSVGSGADPRTVEARQRFCPREDGGATERVLDLVFRGAGAATDIRPARTTGTPAALLSVGSMSQPAQLRSAVARSASLRDDGFDLTVYSTLRGQQFENVAASFPPEVRVTGRVGQLETDEETAAAVEQALRDGAAGLDEGDRESVELVFGNEWSRCFGNTRFQRVIDFDGTDPLNARLLGMAPAPQRWLWLRTDFGAWRDDFQRRGNSDEPNPAALLSAMTAYTELVAESVTTAQVNEEVLAAWVPGAECTVVPSSADPAAVVRAASGPLASAGAGFEFDGGDAVAVLDSLVRQVGLDVVGAELQRRQLLATYSLPAPDHCTFVTHGDLSPGKDHRLLLRAFAQVHRANPDSQLVIIGHGRLERWIAKLIHNYELDGAVRLLTDVTIDSAPLVQACDCFVLSSAYDALPLEAVEASSLGLKIISVEYAGSDDLLRLARVSLVARDVKSLADAMLSAAQTTRVRHQKLTGSAAGPVASTAGSRTR